MADLSVLIRLHKHQLDEKRRVLTTLYGELAAMESKLRALEDEFEAEKKAAGVLQDHFPVSFVAYAQAYTLRRQEMLALMAAQEDRIETAKEDMMETFSELKKFEMAEAERERLAEEERRVRENKLMDDIGLQGYRKRTEEEDRA